jgi:cell division protein FtsA
MEKQQSGTGIKKEAKSARKGSEFFKGLIDKTKGLLMDDYDGSKEY